MEKRKGLVIVLMLVGVVALGAFAAQRQFSARTGLCPLDGTEACPREGTTSCREEMSQLRLQAFLTGEGGTCGMAGGRRMRGGS